MKVYTAHIKLAMIILIIAMSLGVNSCDKKHEYPETVRPSLSNYRVDIPLGKTVEIEVYGANTVNVEGQSRFVEISVEGQKVLFYGKTVGTGEVVISGDGTPMRCCYEVYGSVDNTEESDISDNEDRNNGFAQEIADHTIRFVHGNQTVGLETPGNIFAVSTDRHTLVITSLVTGMEVRLISRVPLTEIQSASDCEMLINGVNIGLKKLKVVNISSERIWIHGESTDRCEIWFVMEI